MNKYAAGIFASLLLSFAFFFSRLAVFVAHPTAAFPDGILLITSRSEQFAFFDSLDALCERTRGGVSAGCRAELLSSKLEKAIYSTVPPLTLWKRSPRVISPDDRTIKADLLAVESAGRTVTPEVRADYQEEAILREILAFEAEARDLHQSSEIRRQMEERRKELSAGGRSAGGVFSNLDLEVELDLWRQKLLVSALKRSLLSTNPVTDEDLNLEYEKVKLGDSTRSYPEFRARHILVPTETEAKKIIEKLKKGANFDELAKKSLDVSSAASGGDLGWNPPGTFVGTFDASVQKLKVGQLTDLPVPTQFGWHIIRLDGIRQRTPAFEEVKPYLKEDIEARKLRDLAKSLRDKHEKR